MATSFLDLLADTERRDLAPLLIRRRYRKDDTIFHEGDPGTVLHIIDKGKVAIRVSTPMAETVTLTLLGRGDVFGEQALINQASTRTASAVAIDKTETLTLNKADFDDLRGRNAKVESFLVHVLAAQVRRLSDHLLEALYVAVDKRVLRRLVSTAELYATDGPGPIVVALRQEDLATMAGTSRVTVNQTLRALEDDALVALGRGRIEVLHLDQIRKRSR